MKLFVAVLLLPLIYLSFIRLINEIIIPVDPSSLWTNSTFASPFSIQHSTLNTLSKLDPFNEDYKYLLSRQLWSVNVAESKRAVENAIILSAVDPKNRLFLGWIRFKQGMAKEGYKEFERAVMLNPKRPDSLAQQGLYINNILPYLETDIRPLFKSLAELNFKVAMELDPSFARHPHYAFALASIYQEKGDNKAASSALRKIDLKSASNWQSALKNIIHYLQLNRRLSAIAQWDASFNLDKLDPEQIFMLESALNNYDIPDLKYFLAIIHFHQGKIDIALNELKSLVDLRGSVLEYRLALGNMYEKAGRHKDALYQYEKVLELSPSNLQAKKKIIEYYSKK